MKWDKGCTGTLSWPIILNANVLAFIEVVVAVVSYAACDCWLHHFFSGSMVIPVTSKLVPILPTSEGSQG